MASRSGKHTSRASKRDNPPSLKTITIRHSAFIPAPPSDVYNAFLNSKTHAAFTGADATCERREGGMFTAWDGYITGRNLRLQKSRRIVQEWKTAEWPPLYPPSKLELQFLPRAQGTEIRLIQAQVPARQAPGYKKGWFEHYWIPLKKYFGKKG